MGDDEHIEPRLDERAIDVALGAVALGAAMAERVARPVLDTAEAVLVLGTHFVRAGPADRVVVALAARGQRVRATARRRLELVLEDLLRRGADLSVTVLDFTEPARRRLDLDPLTEASDADAATTPVDLDAVASRIDLDELTARIDPDLVVARVDAAVARLDLVGIARQLIEAAEPHERGPHADGAAAVAEA